MMLFSDNTEIPMLYLLVSFFEKSVKTMGKLEKMYDICDRCCLVLFLSDKTQNVISLGCLKIKHFSTNTSNAVCCSFICFV